jgi:galactokinase
VLASVRAALAPMSDGPEWRAYFVPGRIEVLGKHTDYAGGRSLVCAVEQGLVVGAAPRSDAAVRVVDVATGHEARLALDPELPQPPDAWMRYPQRCSAVWPGTFRRPGAARIWHF